MISVLLTAIIDGNKQLVMEMLEKFTPEQFSELSKFRTHDVTIIHYLAEHNHVQALKFLVDKLPKELFSGLSPHNSPLQIAISHNNVETVKFFEEYSLDKFASEEQRLAFYGKITTPLSNPTILLGDFSPLKSAVAAGQLATVEVLLAQYLELPVTSSDVPSTDRIDNDKRKKHLLSLIYIAITNKHEDLLKFLLAKTSTLFSSDDVFNWFTTKDGLDLSLVSPFTSLVNTSKNPLATIKLLFPNDDFKEIKKSLMTVAIKQNKPACLAALLSDEDDDESIIDLLLSQVLTTNLFVYLDTAPLNYMKMPDLFDVTLQACSKQFNLRLQNKPELLAKHLINVINKNHYFMLIPVLQALSPETRKALFAFHFPNGTTLLQLAEQTGYADTVKVLKDFGADGEERKEKLFPIPFMYTAAEIIASGEISEEKLARLIPAVESGLTTLNPQIQRQCCRPLFKILNLAKSSPHREQAKKLYQCLSDVFTSATSQAFNALDLFAHNALMGFGSIYEDYERAIKHLNYLSAEGLRKDIPEKMFAFNNYPQITLGRLGLVFCHIYNLSLDDKSKQLQMRSLDMENFTTESFVSLVPSFPVKSFTVEQLKSFTNLFEQFFQDERNFSQVKLSDDFYRSNIVQHYARSYLSILTLFQWLLNLEKLMCPEALDVTHHLDQIEKIHYFAKFKKNVIFALIIATKRIDEDLGREPFEFLAQMELEHGKAIRLEAIFKAKTEEKFTKPAMNLLLEWAIDNSDDKTFAEELSKCSDGELRFLRNSISLADYLTYLIIKNGELEIFKIFFERIKKMNLYRTIECFLPLAMHYNQAAIIDFLSEQKEINFSSEIHVPAYYGEPTSVTLENSLLCDPLNMTPLGSAVCGGHVEEVIKWREVTPREIVPDELLLKLCLHARQLHLLPLIIPNIRATNFLTKNPETNLTLIQEILDILKDDYTDPCPIIEQILQNIDKSSTVFFRTRIADIAMQNGHQEVMLHMLRKLDKADRLKLATYLMTNFPGSKKQEGSTEYPIPLIMHLNIHTFLTREMASDFAQSPATLNNILHILFTAKNSNVLREILVNLPRSTIIAAIKQPHDLLQLAADPKQPRQLYILFKHYSSQELDKTRDRIIKKGSKELDTNRDQIIKKFEAGLNENQKKILTAELTNEQNYQIFHDLLYRLMQGESIKENDIEHLFAKINTSPESDFLLRMCFFQIIDTLHWLSEIKRPNINYSAFLALVNAFLQRNKSNRLNINSENYYNLSCIAFAIGEFKKACNYLQWADYTLCCTTAPDSFHFVRPKINKLILLMLQAFKVPVPDDMRLFYINHWRTTSQMPILWYYPFSLINAENIQLDKEMLTNLLDLLREYPAYDRNQSDITHNVDPNLITDLIIANCNTINTFLSFETKLLQDRPLNADLLFLLYSAVQHLATLLSPSIGELLVTCSNVKIHPQLQVKLTTASNELLQFIDRAKIYLEKERELIDEELKTNVSQKAKSKTSQQSKKTKSKSSSSHSDSSSTTSDRSIKPKKTTFISGSPSSFPDIPQLNTSIDERLFSSTPVRKVKKISSRSAPNTVSVSRRPIPASPQLQPSQKVTFGPSAVKRPETSRSLPDATTSSTGLFKHHKQEKLIFDVERPKVNPKKDKKSKESFDLSAFADFPDLVLPDMGISEDASSESRRGLQAETTSDKNLTAVKIASAPMPSETSPIEIVKDSSLSSGKQTTEAPAKATLFSPASTPIVKEVKQEISKAPSKFDQIPEDIRQILRYFDYRFGASPIYAYLTGGAVRDCLMGRPIKNDFDITVCVCPSIEHLRSMLITQLNIPADKIKIKGVGDKQNLSLEYNNYKIDFVLAKQAKRDFSFNSMYWHPNLARLTKNTNPDFLFDPRNGRLDIQDKKLRFARPDQNFITNKFLFFRAIRFAEEFGFTLDDYEQRKLDEAISQGALAALTKDPLAKASLKIHHEKCLEAFKDKQKYFEKLKHAGMYDGMAELGLVPKASASPVL